MIAFTLREMFYALVQHLKIITIDFLFLFYCLHTDTFIQHPYFSEFCVVASLVINSNMVSYFIKLMQVRLR